MTSKAKTKPMIFKKPVKFEKKEEPKPFNPPKLDMVEAVSCECGNPVHGQSHQCWACSHRA